MEVVAGGVEVAKPAAAATAGERAAKRRRVAPETGARRAGGGVARRGSGRRRRVQADADAAAVQRLFQACRDVFRGPGTVPRPGEVRQLRAMLDRMKPEDVGLSPDLKFFRARDAAQGTPTITHTTIYKCPNFSMVILFLPRNAVIPLHNHPGMTVFSKLLLGSMHIKSYDWVDPDSIPSVSSCSSSADDQLRLAKLVVDDAFTAPCDTSVLYPTTGGNMHRFTANAPCAILDILGPPYSIEEDRDCTYYSDIPYTQHSTADGTRDRDLNNVEQDQGRLAWLKEIDMPRELKMCSVHYGGPPISDK
ncbi:plant cysteine oxidase 2-like [Panicum virgatum]|uniref:cysteine dioxygenase n=1 Tax=Panicum virgatum TaxID=38727 RepID=A0A8T0UMF5_PANVG|nr:plant cysteine oxidase 2-like [Panicum virgatum]KAG2622276.1 hypothetical protein PVAP13_3NG273000 [Panicum virgatum]